MPVRCPTHNICNIRSAYKVYTPKTNHRRWRRQQQLSNITNRSDTYSHCACSQYTTCTIMFIDTAFDFICYECYHAMHTHAYTRTHIDCDCPRIYMFVAYDISLAISFRSPASLRCASPSVPLIPIRIAPRSVPEQRIHIAFGVNSVCKCVCVCRRHTDRFIFFCYSL